MAIKDTPTKINKLGKCPCCSFDWDGGSIADYLIAQKKAGVAYWADKPEWLIREIVADDYGSPDAKHSKLIISDNKAKCPECRHIFINPEFI